MKTAISIPDDVFRAVERLVCRLGVSRSAFFTKAVQEYISNHGYEGVSERLDSVYKLQDSELDDLSQRLQSESLWKEDW